MATNEIINTVVTTFIETALSETIKKLLTLKWKTNTDLGKDILERFYDEDVIKKFSTKINKDILTFRSLSSAGQNVNLDDVYYPLSLKVQDNGDLLKIDDHTTLRHRGVIVISGSAGQGKTTILRKLFLEEIKSKERFPIFINLRDVRFTNELTCIDLIKNFFEGYGIESSSDEVVFLMQSSKVVIFYDGFDEVLQSNRLKARDIIKESWNRYNCPGIVTTRPHTEIYRESGLKNLSVNKIKIEELASIIERIVTDNAQKGAILKLILSKDFLKEALIYPIMIELLLVSYYSMREAPQTISDFYDQLFRNLMYAHDHLKNFERSRLSKLSVSELERVFNSFSACTFSNDRYHFNERQLDSFFKNSITLIAKAKDKIYDANEIRADIVDGTNLISRDGNDFYTFIHKSIQEYHAAKFHIEVDGKEKYIKDLIFDNDPALLNFLRFLYQISPRDFMLFYVVPYMRSLGFKKKSFLNNGYSKSEIIKMLLPNSTVDFISLAGKVSSKYVNVYLGDDKIIKAYHRLRFLVGVLKEILSPDSENKYLSKLSLRRNPYVNTSNLTIMIHSNYISLKDFSPACIINDKGNQEGRLLFTGDLEIIKDKFNEVTYINEDFADYTDLLIYMNDFYAEYIKQYYVPKKRARLKNMVI